MYFLVILDLKGIIVRPWFSDNAGSILYNILSGTEALNNVSTLVFFKLSGYTGKV